MEQDKSVIRSLIQRKKDQIKHFKEDMGLEDKDRSFSKEEYAQKIADLANDVNDLEAQLGEKSEPAPRAPYYNPAP